MSVQGKFLTPYGRKIASSGLKDKSTIEVYTKTQLIGGMNSENDKSDVRKLLKDDDNRAEDTLPPIKGAYKMALSASFEDDQNLSKSRVNDNQIVPE